MSETQLDRIERTLNSFVEYAPRKFEEHDRHFDRILRRFDQMNQRFDTIENG